MDLSDIESWTRELVVSEARRRGIREPELRQTSMLVRLILRDQYGARVTARRKRLGVRLGQVRALVGTVVDALPEALVALRGQEPPARAVPTEPEPPQTRPAARARPQPASAAQPGDAAPQPADASAPEPAQAATPTMTVSKPQAPQRDQPQARPKAKAAAAQSKPAEPTATTPPVASQAGTGAGTGATSPGEDEVVCVGDAAGARVRWATSAVGRERASIVLGEPGQLALRVISIAPDPERTVATNIEDELLDADAGERVLQAAPEGGRRLVAVGLKGANRFVSIAHAKG